MSNKRNGNFSSSEIYKLLPPQRGNKPFLASGENYIQEKVYENRLGLPLTIDTDSKPTNWGNFMERYLFLEYLDATYEDTNNIERIFHPNIEHWCGVPDSIVRNAECFVEIKNPYTRKSFCEAHAWLTEGWETFKANKPDWAWQLVSNSILTGYNTVEFILFMPYKEELATIAEMASYYDGEDQFKYGFLQYADSLPYIEKGGYYENLNRFVFEIPQEDKDLLTERVQLAVEELKNRLR